MILPGALLTHGKIKTLLIAAYEFNGNLVI